MSIDIADSVIFAEVEERSERRSKENPPECEGVEKELGPGRCNGIGRFWVRMAWIVLMDD